MFLSSSLPAGGATTCSNNSMNGPSIAEWDLMAGEWDDIATGYAIGCYKILQEVVDIENILLNQEYASSASSATTILDFGCGTGILTGILQRKIQQLHPQNATVAPSEQQQQQKPKIIAIDPSSSMIDLLKDKIRDREWEDTVSAYTMNFAQLDNQQQQLINEMEGTVDIIIASNVLNYLPRNDMDVTMKMLGKVLKPGSGILFHTDWPYYDNDDNDNANNNHNDDNNEHNNNDKSIDVDTAPTTPPNNNCIQRMTNEKAKQLYAMAGNLQEKFSKIMTMDIPPSLVSSSLSSSSSSDGNNNSNVAVSSPRREPYVVYVGVAMKP